VPQTESLLRRARKPLLAMEENPTPSQLIFASGNWLSREAFQDLAEGAPHGGVFFKLFMQTAARLEEHRAGLLHVISRNERADPIALLHHWLQVHALGHLAVLSFRKDIGWFSEMLRETQLERWTPTHVLVRERMMSIALRGAWAAGQLGESALTLYLPILRSPVEPLEHFNAVLALAMVSLRRRDLATHVRAGIAEWASRGTGSPGFRKALQRSVTLLHDDPDEARAWSLQWCHGPPAVRGGRKKRPPGIERPLGEAERDLLVLAGMNDLGDCAIFYQGLSPAVLLLSHLEARSAEALYPPSEFFPVLARTWSPELAVDVLSRSIPAAPPPKEAMP
jgi:hypothetical protein